MTKISNLNTWTLVSDLLGAYSSGIICNYWKKIKGKYKIILDYLLSLLKIIAYKSNKLAAMSILQLAA